MRHPFDSHLRLTQGPAPLGTIVVAGDPDEEARLMLAAGLVGEARALASGADHFVGDPAHLSGVFEVVAWMCEPAAGVLEAGSRR